jgi:dihydrofolate synthase/folylpolyglutamate synthase
MAITPHLIESYDEAVAFLDSRIGHGVKPGLERMHGVLEVMTNPEESYATIHVAGTNGKTTTVRILDSILSAVAMRTGTYVSPHLHAIEQRYTLGVAPFDEEEFTQAVADVVPFIEHYESTTGESLTYFETTVVVALQAFAAAGVDVAVVEVGLGGRLDATNVVDAAVSVITGIAMDHMEYLGDSIPLIAAEKAAILKEGGVLVTGPLPPAAEGPITAQVEATGSMWLRSGADFRVADVRRAVGGWHCSVDGVHAMYEDIYLPVHGRHQVDHLATAVVAAEMYLNGPLDEATLVAALSEFTSPGRLEVVARHPLVLVDGAHNEQGLEGLASTVLNEFPETKRALVVGFRGQRDVAALLEHLEGLFSSVIVTAATDPMAIPTSEVAAAARAVLGDGVPVEEVTPVGAAMKAAMDSADAADMVVVTGSLYVVSDARDQLVGG